MTKKENAQYWINLARQLESDYIEHGVNCIDNYASTDKELVEEATEFLEVIRQLEKDLIKFGPDAIDMY